jgi:hypothetical protein
LIVLGCLLAPAAIHSVWLHNTLLNTDQYVSTVGPLARNAAVQGAFADRIANTLVTGSNLRGRVQGALPKNASFVVPFIVSGLHGFVHDQALHVLQSGTFAHLWESLNRRVHTQLVDVLRGQGRFVNNNGQVVINIQPVIDKVNTALTKVGVTGLSKQASQSSHQIVLFRSSVLATAQTGVRVLDDLALALPILTVLAFAGGVLASANRRRTIFRGAVGLAFMMLLFLVIWNGLRSPYQHALPASVNRPAAGAVYDQLISFLLLALRTVFALAVVIALAAWLAGPSRIATRVRTTARDLVTRTPGQGSVPSEVSQVVRQHRNGFRLAAVAVGLVILILLNHPGPGTVVAIAIVVLVLLAVIEVLGRAAGPEVNAPEGPGPEPVPVSGPSGGSPPPTTARPESAAPPARQAGSRTPSRPRAGGSASDAD